MGERGFGDPGVWKEALTTPEFMLPLVGSVLPGVQWGGQPAGRRSLFGSQPTTQLRPGALLTALGQTYGLAAQRQSALEAVRRAAAAGVPQAGVPGLAPGYSPEEMLVGGRAPAAPTLAEQTRAAMAPLPTFGDVLQQLTPRQQAAVIAPVPGLGGVGQPGWSPVMTAMQQALAGGTGKRLQNMRLMLDQTTEVLGRDPTNDDARNAYRMLSMEMGEDATRALSWAELPRTLEYLKHRGVAVEQFANSPAGAAATRHLLVQRDVEDDLNKKRGLAIVDAWERTRRYRPDVVSQFRVMAAAGVPLTYEMISVPAKMDAMHRLFAEHPDLFQVIDTGLLGLLQSGAVAAPSLLARYQVILSDPTYAPILGDIMQRAAEQGGRTLQVLNILSDGRRQELQRQTSVWQVLLVNKESIQREFLQVYGPLQDAAALGWAKEQQAAYFSEKSALQLRLAEATRLEVEAREVVLSGVMPGSVSRINERTAEAGVLAIVSNRETTVPSKLAQLEALAQRVNADRSKDVGADAARAKALKRITEARNQLLEQQRQEAARGRKPEAEPSAGPVLQYPWEEPTLEGSPAGRAGRAVGGAAQRVFGQPRVVSPPAELEGLMP